MYHFVSPGDYGSPLIAQVSRGKVLLGIVSQSSCCTSKDKIDKLNRKLKEGKCHTNYSRVSKEMRWILDTVIINTRCHCLAEVDLLWNKQLPPISDRCFFFWILHAHLSGLDQ